MFRISRFRLPVLGLASLLAMGIGCRRWTVVSVRLEGIQDIREIARVRVYVQELIGGSPDKGGYVYDSTRDTNDAFVTAESVSVYLPIGLRGFVLQLWAFNARRCPFLNGSRAFDLGSPGPLTMALNQAHDNDCDAVADAGDAHVDSTEEPGDGSDLAETPIEVAPVVATDAAECGVDVPPVVACPDPTAPDAGGPTPAVGPQDSRCEPYCTDMLAACNDSFTDQDGCLATCSQAGWASSDDLGSGMTTLSCLARYARIAHDNMSTPYGAQQCDIARPSGGICNTLCKTYCALRLNLCGGDAAAAERCADDCQATGTQSPNVVPCLIDILAHDVANDRRYCQWTALNMRCGRCSGL